MAARDVFDPALPVFFEFLHPTPYTLYFPCELKLIDYWRRILDLAAAGLWRMMPDQDEVRRWVRSERGQPVDAYYLLAWIVDGKKDIRPPHGNLRHVVAALAPHAAPAAQKELADGLKSALELRNTFSHRAFDVKVHMDKTRLMQHCAHRAAL